MSITNETLQQHLKEPAVFCCRREKGLTISAADLEDPSLFDDMEEAGLLKLSPDGLKIEQVLGSTLIQDVEALTPITKEVLDKVNAAKEGGEGTYGKDAAKEEGSLIYRSDKVKEDNSASYSTDGAKKDCEKAIKKLDNQFMETSIKTSMGGNGMIHIEIKKAEKLENLNVDIPLFQGVYPIKACSAAEIKSAAEAPAGIEELSPVGAASYAEDLSGSNAKVSGKEKKVIRTLVKKHIRITDVQIGNETTIKDGRITIDGEIVKKALLEDSLCKSMELSVIRPEERHIYTETIMDVCPIATKVEGELGSGITKVADGVVFMLTGVDEDGVQIHEFGSSEGYLDEKMYFGHPGCADENDIIIRCHVVIERLSGMTRPGPFAAHKCQDYVIQAIRNELKKYDGEIVREEVCEDVRRPGNPRIVLVKEIMGQGAMHDNVICPTEPCGILGGQKNVDCGNVPIILTPNQVRDGSIHALTCIGPATKEMTRHYIREPLVEGLAADTQMDLVGVVFVGSPQVNDEKLWVSERLGSLLESLDIDGCIITTEGFGNNHIDFIQHIAQAGKRKIPVVGVSFCAYQGQLVVGNPYADAMIEENMDMGGFENNVAGCSCVTKEVAARAIQMLKNKMAGIKIKPAPKKWSNEVVNANNRLLGLPETVLLDNGTLH